MIKTFFIELPTERLKGSIFYHLSPPVDYVGPLWIKSRWKKRDGKMASLLLRAWIATLKFWMKICENLFVATMKSII